MSVLIVTSLGDIVVDLFTDKCPLTSKNFLKLCKIKYYNGCLFHTVQKDFTAQTGDPTGTGAGGDSVYKFMYGDQARFFGDEIHLDLKHSKTGTVAMASGGENLNASQFYITLRDDLDYLDGKHTVFGEVAEGLETLNRINEAYVDEKNRPYKNIRIKHTYILDDPFEDPPQLAELIPDASPEGKPKDEVDDEVRLEDDWVPMDEQLGPAELEEVLRANEAHTRAVVLESIGDIPEAEIKPPENVLFVCKLNPVTEDEDLHTIFSRFGTVTSAEIIRDYKTGDSLCYAFIEFEDQDACERAFFKMDNALIDDRRIHVDFSQSVAKLWYQYRRKDNQRGGGRGCFKCGETDHIAKDCTGGSVSKTQSAKYILKDNNMQRGGGDNSSFEMVFDEDARGSPREKARDGCHDSDDHTRRQKMHRSSDDLRHRDREWKDSSDRYRERDRNRGHKQDERHHESRESPYLKEHLGRRKEREYDRRDDQTSRSRSDTERDDRGHARRTTDGDDFVETNEHRDGRRRVGDTRASRRDDTDYTKRGSDGDYRKRAAEDDTSRSELDGRDSKRRHADSDRRGSRDEPSRRKHDSYKERREDHEQRHRGVEKYDRDARDHDRRHHSDRRR